MRARAGDPGFAPVWVPPPASGRSPPPPPGPPCAPAASPASRPAARPGRGKARGGGGGGGAHDARARQRQQGHTNGEAAPVPALGGCPGTGRVLCPQVRRLGASPCRSGRTFATLSSITLRVCSTLMCSAATWSAASGWLLKWSCRGAAQGVVGRHAGACMSCAACSSPRPCMQACARGNTLAHHVLAQAGPERAVKAVGRRLARPRRVAAALPCSSYALQTGAWCLPPERLVCRHTDHVVAGPAEEKVGPAHSAHCREEATLWHSSSAACRGCRPGCAAHAAAFLVQRPGAECPAAWRV